MYSEYIDRARAEADGENLPFSCSTDGHGAYSTAPCAHASCEGRFCEDCLELCETCGKGFCEDHLQRLGNGKRGFLVCDSCYAANLQKCRALAGELENMLHAGRRSLTHGHEQPPSDLIEGLKDRITELWLES